LRIKDFAGNIHANLAPRVSGDKNHIIIVKEAFTIPGYFNDESFNISLNPEGFHSDRNICADFVSEKVVVNIFSWW
jgi:hypothetical protein